MVFRLDVVFAVRIPARGPVDGYRPILLLSWRFHRSRDSGIVADQREFVGTDCQGSKVGVKRAFHHVALSGNACRFCFMRGVGFGIHAASSEKTEKGCRCAAKQMETLVRESTEADKFVVRN